MSIKMEWKYPPQPRCPNQESHGELAWHPLGGLVCEKCRDEHTARSRVPYRFGNPSGWVLDKTE
jgi:hypothetical protein